MGDADDLVAAMTWVAVGLCVAVVLAAVAIIYFCCWNNSEEEDERVRQQALLDGLLRRDQLENTLLEHGDDPNAWQCVVCAYANSANRKTCIMCGTSATFLLQPAALLSSNRKPNNSNGLVRLKSSSTLLLNNEADDPHSLERTDDDDADQQHMRQRALVKRRMNAMAMRKDLSQRQRGAIRRRLWERKLDASDNAFHWVRQNSTDVFHETALSGNAFVHTSNGRVHVAAPLESIADLHNLRSQGFVWQYDELGRLAWKKAEDVAIDMESFAKVQRGTNESEQIDFEGIMAMDFRVKKQWFLIQLSRLATPVTKAVAKLPVTRDNILEETLERLTTASPEALHTYLKISFANEPGIDAGGLLREWFSLVVTKLFSAELGLFIPTKGEDMSYWINPMSGTLNARHLAYFRLAGILIGKAFFEGLVLDVHLALPLLKHVLSIPISFSDLEYLDDELFRTSKWLQTTDQNVADLCLTFSLMLASGVEVELKPHGRHIDVTNDNKHEYLQLVLEHRMLQSISEQLQEVLRGLYDVVPKELLSVFDYQELELLLCGIPTIDPSDWHAHTQVRYIAVQNDNNDDNDNANKRSKKTLQQPTQAEQDVVLTWFWTIVDRFSPEERARLLQFTTGTSRVPVEGFRGLMSSSGIIHPFTIQLVPGRLREDEKAGDARLFPKAHTCFNRLELPVYQSEDEMETYLTIVTQMEIVGFGLE